MSYTLGELAEKCNAKLHGDANLVIDGVATLASAQKGHISFLANSLYKKNLANTQASAVVLSDKDKDECIIDNVIVSNNPQLVFCQIIELFHPAKSYQSGIDKSVVSSGSSNISNSVHVGANSVIGSNSTLHANVVIQSNVCIGDDVTIGENSFIHANVTICDGVKVGKGVIIHPGAVIGADGFGLVEVEHVWKKIPQVGSVIIEDDVEIGANTTIDRGAMDDTIIKRGVKIDNQIQIGHNCYIDEDTAIAACTGISGSTKIGKRCKIGGGSGFNGHLTICDDVMFTGFSMVTKSISEPGVYSSGLPLKDNLSWRKNIARFNQLGNIVERISSIEKQLKD